METSDEARQFDCHIDQGSCLMTAKLELLQIKTEEAAKSGFVDNNDLLDEILTLRSEVLEDLAGQTEVTPAQKAILRFISEQDHVLVEHMESAKSQIAVSLNKLAQSKIHKQFYEQTYEAGSYFIDKKK